MRIGDPIISFNLLGIDGKSHGLEEYSDKEVIVVMFSCNHCPYVKAYEERFVAIQSDYADKGVLVVAINPNDDSVFPADSFENMKVRAREKGFNFPYLRDEDQNVAKVYEAKRTPEVFVFDKKRVLRYHGRIDDNVWNPGGVKVHYLRDALDAVFEGRQVLVEETSPVGCTIKWAGKFSFIRLFRRLISRA